MVLEFLLVLILLLALYVQHFHMLASASDEERSAAVEGALVVKAAAEYMNLPLHESQERLVLVLLLLLRKLVSNSGAGGTDRSRNTGELPLVYHPKISTDHRR